MKLKNVDDVEEGETMKVSIVRNDLADPMLTHEYRDMRIVKEVTGQQGGFIEYPLCNIRVPIRWNEHIQSRRSEKSRDKTPGLQPAPWPPHDARMCSDPQEFIKDGPGDVPGINSASLVVEPAERFCVKWGIRIRGVNENVGVNQNHSLSLSPFHGLIQTLAIRNIDQRSAAMKRGQRSEFSAFSLRTEKIAECSLDKLGHRSPLASGFAFQLRHNSIIYLKCRLHMENHIKGMGIRQHPGGVNS
jgi:hypothetical protein